MSSLRKRKLWATLIVCGIGTALQALPHGCADFNIRFALQGFDFCSVLNCTGSSFVNFCNPPMLVDCPTTTTP